MGFSFWRRLPRKQVPERSIRPSCSSIVNTHCLLYSAVHPILYGYGYGFGSGAVLTSFFSRSLSSSGVLLVIFCCQLSVELVSSILRANRAYTLNACYVDRLARGLHSCDHQLDNVSHPLPTSTSRRRPPSLCFPQTMRVCDDRSKTIPRLCNG